MGQTASLFRPQDVLERVAAYGDPFRAALEVEQELPPDEPFLPEAVRLQISQRNILWDETAGAAWTTR